MPLTVKVVNWKPPVQGQPRSPFLIINESDFDPAKHKLYEDADTVAGREPPPAPPPAKGYDEVMSSKELIEYGAKHFGVKLNPRSPKADLIAALDEQAAKKAKV